MADNQYSAWDELRILQDTTIKLWLTYINWFTWFFGINLLALSWIFTSKDIVGQGVLALSILLSTCDFLGVGAAVFILRHHHNATRRAALLAVGEERPDIEILFSDLMARFVGWSTGTALAGVMVAWIYIALAFGKSF